MTPALRAVAIFFLLVLLGSPAWAADFRVENKVFLGAETKPTSQSVTLFSAGVVYDYLAEPDEVTIFDRGRGRFILLDVARRVKTELSTASVAKTIDGLRQRAAASDDPRLRFLCDPRLDRQPDESPDELVFKSSWVTYRVVGVKTESPEMAAQYREFSDWYARLNAFLRPGSQPPFARLLVNEAVAQRGEIPRSVRVTQVRRQGPLAQETQLRSEHRLTRELMESDRRRVAQTEEYLALFSLVGYRDYAVRATGAKR